ncbi:VanZ like family protein [compost metagenome]
MSSAVISERLPLLLQPPFLSYYVNSEAQAVRDALIKLLMTLPVGMLAHLVLPAPAAPSRRLATAFFLTLCAMFFAGVELGQLTIPSRYPDNTDVLLAMAGVSAGLGLARRAIR